MKKTLFICFIVASWMMATTVRAQLTIGEQYKIYSEAAPANAIYMTGSSGENARFNWDLPDAGDYFKVNGKLASLGEEEVDVFEFELRPGVYLKPSGGGLSPCNTYDSQNYDFNWWYLIEDGDPEGGVQYYVVQNMFRPTRFLYFNPDDPQQLYTNEVGEDGPPYNTNRKYYRVAFEKSSSPAVSLSTAALAFSSSFLSKPVVVTGTNITGDITFIVPEGITLSGSSVVNSDGTYSIPAAGANAANTVIITADSYDRELSGEIVVTTPGVLSPQIITLRGGLKVGTWYNLPLLSDFGVPVNLGDSIGTDDGISYVASAVPDATAPTQAFSFLPVTYAGDEAFFIRNALGNYLAAEEDDDRYVVWHSSLVGSEYEEWSLSGRAGDASINYFGRITFRTGRTDAPIDYLGLRSDYSFPGYRIAAIYPKNWFRGTFYLRETQAVVINYVDGAGNELKLPRVVLTGLTVDGTYTVLGSDKADISFNGQTCTYNAAASIEQVVVGLGNSVINLVFSNPSGIKDVNAAKAYQVYADSNRRIIVSGYQPAEVSVYNVAGQKIAGQLLNAGAGSIELPDAGIYIVNIRSNYVAETHKIVLK
jgi:hypothetical protein